MRKHRKFLLLLACLAALVILAALLSREREPSYQGHPLSYWLGQYSPTSPLDPQAVQAISQIGTNALPLLLKYLRYEPKPDRFKQSIIFVMDKAPDILISQRLLTWAETDNAEIAAMAAAEAFAALGPRARPALPELEKMLSSTNPNQIAIKAQLALANIGKDGLPLLVAVLDNPAAPGRIHAVFCIAMTPALYTNAAPAIPALLRCLKETNSEIQCVAAVALGNAAMQPDLVVPALTNAFLATTNLSLRRYTVAALGDFGPRARATQTLIIAALRDPDPGLRVDATNALRLIAPETLTNTPAP